MEDKHFDKVFWFIVGAFIAVVLFDVAVIFVPVPNGGQKYADILVGSLNTGVLMQVINYLLGGTPQPKKNDSPTASVSGDNPIVNVTPSPEQPVNTNTAN